MKAKSINEIKKELKNLQPVKLHDICMRLAKFKKENKQLLTYILFESENEATYIQNTKLEIDQYFDEINFKNLHITIKNIRKILSFTIKSAKFSSIATTEIDLLIYFCQKIKNCMRMNYQNYYVILNLYNRVFDKIQKNIAKLHEDIQFDYNQEMLTLE